jgi:hypothetical protein
MVAAYEQRVELAEPCLKRGEAGAVLARLHLGNERCYLAAEGVDIEVVAAAAETARAAERVTLGMNTEGAVTLDKLALDPVALSAVTGAAHGTPFGIGFACGKRYAAGSSPTRASISFCRDATHRPPIRRAGK